MRHFSFEADTSRGRARVPPTGSLALRGREAKIFVTDLPFGRSYLLYSSWPLFWAGAIGHIDIVIFRTSPGDTEGHAELIDRAGAHHRLTDISLTNGGHAQKVRGGTVVLWLEDTSRVWNPLLDSDDPSDQVIVFNPYLVRNASITSEHLSLYGDVDVETLVEVWAPSRVRRISWNGSPVDMSPTQKGYYSFAVAGPPSHISLPALHDWRYHDGMPELNEAFDDEHWTLADHTTTAKPFMMEFGDTVLFACDYGLRATVSHSLRYI